MKTLKFDELKSIQKKYKAVEEMAFEEATLYREATIAILEGKDIIGTGRQVPERLLHFGIPLIESIDKHSKIFRFLCYAQQENFKIQVAEEMNNLSKVC